MRYRLDSHAACELGVGAPGVAVHGIVLAVAEACADTVAENVDGVAKHAGLDHIVHFDKRRTEAVGKADDYLRVILLCHGNYLLCIFQSCGNGLFKIQRNML